MFDPEHDRHVSAGRVSDEPQLSQETNCAKKGSLSFTHTHSKRLGRSDEMRQLGQSSLHFAAATDK